MTKDLGVWTAQDCALVLMAGRLEGKVCVVTGTGTGSGMGRATALTFAREGASVVGCDVAVEPASTSWSMAA
jgi:NAD(P)-dependent dehydrogenase (short-subunit alcohol dehydrogenase family)